MIKLGERPFFYPGFDKRKIWSLSNRPPVDDVIKMEANFMLFRDYTLINIMMLQTLVNIYRDDKDLPNANALKEQYINQVGDLKRYPRFTSPVSTYWGIDAFS